MSNLSELLPSGGGQNAVEFVASGTLSAGTAVILKSNGQVTTATETAIAPAAAGSTVNVIAQASEHHAVAADPHNDNRWVICWTDDAGSKDLQVKVITRSGTSLTVSSSSIANSSTNANASVTFDTVTENKFLLVWDRNTSTGTAVVGTISGAAGSESISYGSENTFTSQKIYGTKVSPLGTTGNYIATWGNSSNKYPYARILTISGTSVSASGSDTVISSAAMYSQDYLTHAVQAGSSTKVLAAWLASDRLKGIELTISGTTISSATLTTIDSSTLYSTDLRPLISPVNATTYVGVGMMNGSGDYVYSLPITVSSGTITSGTKVTVVSASGYYYVSMDNNLASPNIFSISYGKNNAYPTGIIGTMSASSTISFATAYALSSTATRSTHFGGVAQQSDSFGYCISPWRSNTGCSAWGYVALGTSGGALSDNEAFIGVTSEAISNGATGVVNVLGGINEAQTGLTIGSSYYMQGDGAISTVNASPAVKIGIAISATTINIKDLP